MDIRKKTALIIHRDGKYLVGKIIYSSDLRWSENKWDAWRTRIRAEALSVQGKVGGEIMLFNPIAGHIRKARL